MLEIFKSNKGSEQSLDGFRQNIFLVVTGTGYVSSRFVLTNDKNCVSISSQTDSELGGGLPHNLGEMPCAYIWTHLDRDYNKGSKPINEKPIYKKQFIIFP